MWHVSCGIKVKHKVRKTERFSCLAIRNGIAKNSLKLYHVMLLPTKTLEKFTFFADHEITASS